MKARIEIKSGAYGFGHTWTLIINESKWYYLGQDVKFCSRILNISPSDIIQQIGSNDLMDAQVNERLANFILEDLGLTEEILGGLQSWELSAE
jgi:hypothetical protein